ncbi:BTAD domain-containing putative transcriptional regulator [Winogradskya consettensis]|uniref:SARP family transcriptional regulator n=1 Tax=Winogradskya consettensis TaxID=113560 RepID=A0A919STR1_9ACTN|nr:BTAD domain-containing putative transcriptional regulator [Actinoplanes consettensis]GIM77774.1 SARP family transcriptional regulator [Actinoplanes consettensis]
MRITTLGPLAVDGQPVRGERLAVVVRELVGARGRPVSAGALAEAVWHGDPPDDAAGAVQALVSRVRRLGVPVNAVAGGYRVPADQVETDVVAARTLADRARAALNDGDPAAARKDADEARALFPPVPDLVDAGVARLFSEIAAVRAQAALAGAGAPDEDDLRRLVVRTPPDEPAAALLVRVLAAQSRDAEALEVVERLRAELADRYGTDPSQAITEVHLALLRGELTPAPVTRLKPRTTALPASWRRSGTTLVGRERDLAAVVEGLAEAPLVTVVATGGAGKTRLAAEVSRRAEGAVRVIELAGVRTPGEVLPAVLAALGGADTTSTITLERRVLTPPERLRAVAPDLDGLIVFDNCEHVLNAAATVVADLIAAAPEVAVLATSRAPLGLAGEIVHRLAALPDEQALDLLQRRARAGGAVPTWDDERALRLCHRLDNLPLALELAAARLRYMPIDDVLSGLGDRFALLDDALRGLPERHASLWAMVDWSRELLAPADQELMQRLAVIPASFTAATAASVAGRPDVRRGLAALVEQSLLVLEDGDGGPPRYRMLETVREYGEARLGDRNPAMDGLVAWARTVSVELAGRFIGPHQLDAFATASRELENLAGALRWTMAHDDTAAMVDVAAAVLHLWTVRGLHLEVSALGRIMLHIDEPANRRRILDADPLPDADRLAWVCLLITINSGITGPPRLAALSARVLRALMATRAAEVSARNTALADVLPMFHNFESPQSRAGVERMIASDDRYVRALGLFARAAFQENSGLLAEGLVNAEAAYADFEAVGDHWGMAMAAQVVGNSVLTRDAGRSVEWLARGVHNMDLVGAAQDARSLRVVLDAQLALGGDADAEQRLRDIASSGLAEAWDEAQAYLGLAHLAWQHHSWGEVLRYADAITRVEPSHDTRGPLPEQSVGLRIAAAVLYLSVTAVHPTPGAATTAKSLLALTQEEAFASHDAQMIGAWSVGGAVLAAHNGDERTARELWSLGMRSGANITSLFPPGETMRLAAALENEDHRRDTRPDNVSGRIRELMTDLVRPSSGTP